MALLEIEGLVVRFRTHEGTIYAVNGVSFQVDEGETLGLVGESGCGKSVTSLAVMRLLPSPAGHVEGGRVRLDGTELLDLTEAEMRDLRGREVAMIFQDPMTSLNPVLTIQEQMVETIRAHTQMTADAGHGPRRRAARHGGHPAPRDAPQGLPPRVQRRHAAARDDRHGPRSPPAAADRRRAHDGPRRDDPGAGPGAAARP